MGVTYYYMSACGRYILLYVCLWVLHVIVCLPGGITYYCMSAVGITYYYMSSHMSAVGVNVSVIAGCGV